MLQELAIERPKVRAHGSVAHRSMLSAHYEALLRQIHGANTKASTAQAIGIVSCASGAGVSTVAFNLAVTAARADCGPVLLVDADISKPLSDNVLAKTPSLGLADILADTAEPSDCAEPTSIENLSVVAGRGNSERDLSSVAPAKFAELLNEYKRQFGLLVVDIPAPTELNGSIHLAGQLDGVVLVLEAERADARAALRMKQQLVDAGANLLGVVLNKRRQHVPGWLYHRL